MDISHSLDTFRYAAALKPAPRTKTPESHSSSTPMAWTRNRLAGWFAVQSSGKVSMDDLLLDDLKKPEGEFVPPPWKFLYEMPESEWVARCNRMASQDAKQLRFEYRTLFLKKRATTKSTEVTSTYPIETIMLVEPKKVVTTRDRHQEAMMKLAAKGQAARLKSAAKRK
jgi:hypothetical protein